MHIEDEDEWKSLVFAPADLGATFERMVSLLVEKKEIDEKTRVSPPRRGAISRAAHIKKWINKLKRLGKEGIVLYSTTARWVSSRAGKFKVVIIGVHGTFYSKDH